MAGGVMMINYPRMEYTGKFGGALLRPLLGIAVFCALSAAVVPLYAENLPDPTRPPADVLTAYGARHGRLGESSSGLRSIIISGTRRAAIIDGKTVELGGRAGNARLVAVDAGSVVLQRGRNRQVLSLFPGVKILHIKTPDTGSTNMNSTSKAIQAERPLPANNGASPNRELQPAAKQELIPVHPKEEK